MNFDYEREHKDSSRSRNHAFNNSFNTSTIK